MATKAKLAPVASGNPEGDTPKVDRSIIIFNWQKKVKVYTTNEQGQPTSERTTKKANLILSIAEATRDIFNIPKFTPSDAVADEIETYAVKAYTYTRYKNIGDAQGVAVEVPAHRRKKPASTPPSELVKHHIQIPVLDKKTAKGYTRTVSFSFPTFFSVAMLCQAVGTMLAGAPSDRKTPHFIFQGRRHPIPYGAPKDQPFAGFDHGAWLATALIEPSGGGTDVIIVDISGDRDGTATGGTP